MTQTKRMVEGNRAVFSQGHLQGKDFRRENSQSLVARLSRAPKQLQVIGLSPPCRSIVSAEFTALLQPSFVKRPGWRKRLTMVVKMPRDPARCRGSFDRSKQPLIGHVHGHAGKCGVEARLPKRLSAGARRKAVRRKMPI